MEAPARLLYLLRHAKSSWSDPALADEDRPLAPRGRRDAKRIAHHLIETGVEPELVLCSPAERTRQTLARLRPALDAAVVTFVPAFYAASAEDLLERLHSVPDGVASVMIIAHNPGLQDLALALTKSGDGLDRLRAKFPTAALATLTVPKPWSRLSQADAELAAYVVPKQLNGEAGRLAATASSRSRSSSASPARSSSRGSADKLSSPKTRSKSGVTR
jgi:phosphohistidine phosphatase